MAKIVRLRNNRINLSRDTSDVTARAPGRGIGGVSTFTIHATIAAIFRLLDRTPTVASEGGEGKVRYWRAMQSVWLARLAEKSGDTYEY